jgi:hypothetical protein
LLGLRSRRLVSPGMRLSPQPRTSMQKVDPGSKQQGGVRMIRDPLCCDAQSMSQLGPEEPRRDVCCDGSFSRERPCVSISRRSCLQDQITTDRRSLQCRLAVQAEIRPSPEGPASTRRSSPLVEWPSRAPATTTTRTTPAHQRSPPLAPTVRRGP